MKFGAHISAAGGVQNLPTNAKNVGAKTFQCFSRSPQGGKAPLITEEQQQALKVGLKQLGIKHFYIHAPYYINLASPKKALYKSAIRILKEELERGTLLGATGMMFHPGSAKGQTKEEAMKQVIEGIAEILERYDGSCLLLIENSAGAGEIIGDTMDEIGTMIKALRNKHKKVGICLDTQHMFASGYDLATKKAVNQTFSTIEKEIGWKNVKVMHFNDSETACGSHKDRHANIGKGKIGMKGFQAILAHPRMKNMDMIVETPGEERDRKQDIQTLKKLANT